MADRRVFIRAVPTQETIEVIKKFARHTGLPIGRDFLCRPHATIVYGNAEVNAEDIVLPEVKYPIIGTNPRLRLLLARDYVYCLSMSFESEAMASLNEAIRVKYDIKENHKNFLSHLTLKRGGTRGIINLTREIPFDLMFDRIKIDGGWVKNQQAQFAR